MSAPEEMTLTAFPRIVGIVAEACYNDPEARHLADKENLVDYDDADVSTQQFWRHIATTAMEASGQAELSRALTDLLELVCTHGLEPCRDFPPHEFDAIVDGAVQDARKALAKALGQ